jgi:hypothetical protein
MGPLCGTCIFAGKTGNSEDKENYMKNSFFKNSFLENSFFKKMFLAAAIVCLTAAVCGAQRYATQKQNRNSFGGGVMFGSDFGGGVEHEISYNSSVTGSLAMPYIGGGAFVFFDMTYLEADAGIFVGSGDWKLKAGSPVDVDAEFGRFLFTGVDVALFGKYPFTVSRKIKVFPLLGVAYQAVFYTKRADNEKIGDAFDYSQLWFKAGGGIDYDITRNVYFRAEALYGLRLATQMEKGDSMKVWWRDAIYQAKGITANITEGKTLLGHGLTAKVAIGYRF